MKKVSEKLLLDNEKAENQVLDDEELNIVGGAERCNYIHNTEEICTEGWNKDVADSFCLADYACIAIVFHASEKPENGVDFCFMDYMCIFAYEI